MKASGHHEEGCCGQPRARAFAETATANPFAMVTIDLAAASQAKMRHRPDLERMYLDRWFVVPGKPAPAAH